MALQMGNWGEVTPRNEVITLLTIGTGPPCRCFFFPFLMFTIHNFMRKGRCNACTGMHVFCTFKLKT